MSFRALFVGWSCFRNRAGCGLSLCLIFLCLPSLATIGVQYQMLLGNPSSATVDPNNHDHYLVQRDVEALDYSDNLRQPNWASWHYTSGDSGSSGRSPFFFVDTSLPSGFYQVQTFDYSGSGYDRGHMCPSADRTDTVVHNEATFLMSNIIPQAPDNNQGVWANLETYSRTLAGGGNEVLVTCGPEGFSGARTTSSGQILIASNVWKIIVVVPPGPGSTLARITNSTRVIAVNIPNIQGIRNDPWQNYLTSVNHLQTNTGFTFFTALNSNLATVLRTKIDGSPATSITGFTPGTGTTTTSVVINGNNFAGTTAVKFGGVSAPFTLNSGNKITATVPSEAATGPISVIAAGGLATSASTFTVESLVLTPPTLFISHAGSNVIVSWSTNATGYTLQQNTNLNPTNWTTYPDPVTISGTNKIATLTPSPGNLFLRLRSE